MLALIIVIASLVYITVAGFSGAVYYHRALAKHGCKSKENLGYCMLDHEMPAILTGLLWPIAVPFRLAYDLGSGDNARIKMEKARRKALEEQKHKTELARQKALEAEFLERELEAYNK